MRHKARKSPPFVMLEHDIVKGNGWKKLKGSSVKLFIFLRSKALGRFDDAITQKIMVSYREMTAATGLSLQTIREAIIKLENMGFIDFVEQGGLKSGGYGKNVYKLSIRYLKYGSDVFSKGIMKKEHGVTSRGFGEHKKWRHHKKICTNAENNGSNFVTTAGGLIVRKSRVRYENHNKTV